MSSEVNRRVPRTAVDLTVSDPVEAARAELQAALYANEDKLNVPLQAEKATVKAQAFARREPRKAIAVAVGVAAIVGVIVWAGVRSLTAPRR